MSQIIMEPRNKQKQNQRIAKFSTGSGIEQKSTSKSARTHLTVYIIETHLNI